MPPVDRENLIAYSKGLTESDLRSFIGTFHKSTEYSPTANHGTTDIATYYVDWAESTRGPGLQAVAANLRVYLGKDPASCNRKPKNLTFASLLRQFVGRRLTWPNFGPILTGPVSMASNRFRLKRKTISL